MEKKHCLAFLFVAGDYEFQNDQVPEGMPEQLDSIPDSTGPTRH